MRLIWLKILVLVVCALPLGSAAQNILFRNYSVADGLSSNTIWAISQDEKGYMWFGTKNGLCRFDGYQFKTYRFNHPNATGGNRFIHTLYAPDSTHYWVGTDDGVFILDLENEQFSKFEPLGENLVFDIIGDRKGNIWAGTKGNGIYCYNPQTKDIRNFRMERGNPHSLSRNQVRKLEEDTEGNIWIGTFGEGIDVLNPVTGKFVHYKAGNTNGPGGNFILNLFKDRAGNIWVGTLSGGMSVWRKEQKVFEHYTSSSKPVSISDNIVRSISQAKNGNIYVGTEKGLNVLDPVANRIIASYSNKSNDPLSLSDNSIYAIYPDRDGGVWLGTYFGGVSYFPEKGYNFDYYYATGEPNSLSGNAVSCFLEDEPGKLWVGTENAGLNYFNTGSGNFSQYPARETDRLSYHNVHALFKDRKKRLWVGTFTGGVDVFDPATGKVKNYRNDSGNARSLSNNMVYRIYEDRDGNIWVGTVKGLNKYNPDTDDFTQITDMNLHNNCIYDICEDDAGNIWFATYDSGLIGMDKKSEKWTRYSVTDKNGPSSNKIISLLDDHKGGLWLGTEGGGLNRLDLSSRKITYFSEEQGFAAIIFGILQDNSGHLWLSTNDGIVRFNPATGKKRRYSQADNLQSKQFNYKAFYKDSEGRFYFGGIQGFNAFHPDSITDYPSSSHITLTNFQLFNKDVQPGTEESPLSQVISYQKEITLQHDQSVLSIEYAALNFVALQRVQYAYKMDGFDENWNYVGEQRKATYTNLPAGDYVFRVKATDGNGEWSEQEATMRFSILPPFYLSTWAYILYFLVAVAAVYWGRKIFIKRIRQRNEIRLERLRTKKEQEFYNQKIEFFTAMAHEIRTPLSLIIAPLEKLMEQENWRPEVKEQLEVMDENSGRLLSLVNQLLDFRRIESDIYEIHSEEIELISFVHAIYARFSGMSYQKGIKFSMTTSMNRLLVQADPEALTKILNNLLINAFKFARTKVELKVNEPVAHAGKQYFSVSVEDDGIGIPEAHKDQIFKKFFTVTSGPYQYNNTGGTGIGLALAKSLSEKHEGFLEVNSEEGVKTEFLVMVPYLTEQPEIPSSKNVPEEAETSALPLALVVEDDHSLQDFISKSMRAEGYNVLRAGNGKEALQVLENNSVELIVSDVMMPEMDGMELCKAVKNNLQYSHIPLILLTARTHSEAEIEGIQNGADAYIAKPFKWKHVAAVIRNLTESRAKLVNGLTRQPMADLNTITTNTHDKKFVETIISVIEERITDPQLSVEELSREMSMSRSSLHKKLKAMSGYSPNEFIRLIRLKKAARLLLSGEHNISEVGYLTGFNSPSYFSKCFQQQFAQTPTEFLAAAQVPGSTVLVDEMIDRGE